MLLRLIKLENLWSDFSGVILKIEALTGNLSANEGLLKVKHTVKMSCDY